jgi:hypothetical protein
MITLAPDRRKALDLPVVKLAPAPTSDRQYCEDVSCDLLALWVFVFHNDSAPHCHKEHYCQDHTDGQIYRWNHRFTGLEAFSGPHLCLHCKRVYGDINRFMRVERIP